MPRSLGPRADRRLAEHHPTQAGEPGREYERVKLLTYGLVKLVGDAAAETGFGELTQTGTIFAVAHGARAGARPAVDGRADLDAFGILIFEMLTGRIPFAVPIRSRSSACRSRRRRRRAADG